MNKQIRILLVDDETDFTSTLSKRLERHGMEVATAADSSEAFGVLESERFDVVVLDFLMPGIDGMQALKSIRKNFHGVEVILLTGNGTTSRAMTARTDGAFAFLTKPTRFDFLLEKIVDAANVKALEGDPRWSYVHSPSGSRPHETLNPDY